MTRLCLALLALSASSAIAAPSNTGSWWTSRRPAQSNIYQCLAEVKSDVAVNNLRMDVSPSILTSLNDMSSLGSSPYLGFDVQLKLEDLNPVVPCLLSCDDASKRPTEIFRMALGNAVVSVELNKDVRGRGLKQMDVFVSKLDGTLIGHRVIPRIDMEGVVKFFLEVNLAHVHSMMSLRNTARPTPVAKIGWSYSRKEPQFVLALYEQLEHSNLSDEEKRGSFQFPIFVENSPTVPRVSQLLVGNLNDKNVKAYRSIDVSLKKVWTGRNSNSEKKSMFRGSVEEERMAACYERFLVAEDDQPEPVRTATTYLGEITPAE